LARDASFHSNESITPSNRGIKRLEFLGWSPAVLPRWGRVRMTGVIMKAIIERSMYRSAPKGANAAITKG
jgi:hypothetical protein